MTREKGDLQQTAKGKLVGKQQIRVILPRSSTRKL
jgi:hypothetical protein